MIDWLTVRVPCRLPRPIDGGRFLRLNRAGEVETATPLRLSVPGSFSSSLTVRAPSIGELEISGNPAKWLAGHNLYGSDCLKTLLWATLERLATLPDVLPWSLPSIGLHGPESLSEARVTRVDVNYMALMDAPADVASFVRSASQTGSWGHRGKGAFREGTVVYGRGSGRNRARSELVIYDKGSEVVDHKLPGMMAEDPEVLAWVKRCLRVELKLFRLTLQELGLGSVEGWSEGMAPKVWRSAVEKLTFSDAAASGAVDLMELPKMFRSTVAFWKTGEDVRKLLSKPTYYRHRKAIRELTGLDIALPPPPRPIANVVPLKRVLEARFVARPPWADRIDAQLREAGAIVVPFAA